MKKPPHEVRAVARVQGNNLSRPDAIHLDDFPGVLSDRRYRAINNVLIPADPQPRVDDGMKSVRISAEAYERLRQMRGVNETPSQCLERMIFDT